MELVPVTLAECRRFIAEHHRHNIPPVGWKFGVGLRNGGPELVGVAVASRPVARMLDDGQTLEVTRTCTDGTPNANSKLYGAIARAAKALGYRRLVTYTLESETGVSLRAAGFSAHSTVPANREWDRISRRRYQQDIFGNNRRPLEAKVRWERGL